MSTAILVLNAGSSSLKFSLFSAAGEALDLRLRGEIEGLYTSARFLAYDAQRALRHERSWGGGDRLGHDGAIAYLLDLLRVELGADALGAVGHRVVHGGAEFSAPVRLDADVVAALERLIPLAPLHQAHNLAPVKIIAERAPQLTQIACFDTAFHRTQPFAAETFALPRNLIDRGVRRYGFHGLSYEYIASVLPKHDSTAAAGRVIVAHLGNGASMCAMDGGKSIATTMGFTPLDGLVMGTRGGSLDPGVVLYCLTELGMDAAAVADLLYRQSGLLGVSGISSDMRTLLANDSRSARDAVDLFVYRCARELGSLAAALGGVDALVFTAGIGENAAAIRERICLDARWLGVDLDPGANAAGGPRITTEDSRASAWVIPTDEELMIARHVRAMLPTR